MFKIHVINNTTRLFFLPHWDAEYYFDLLTRNGHVWISKTIRNKIICFHLQPNVVKVSISYSKYSTFICKICSNTIFLTDVKKGNRLSIGFYYFLCSLPLDFRLDEPISIFSYLLIYSKTFAARVVPFQFTLVLKVVFNLNKIGWCLKSKKLWIRKWCSRLDFFLTHSRVLYLNVVFPNDYRIQIELKTFPFSIRIGPSRSKAPQQSVLGCLFLHPSSFYVFR